MTSELEWTPPGPGSWTLAADHYPRPITATHRAFMPIWSEASTSIMGDLPIDGVRMEAVNGFPYMTVLGDSPGKVPPPWVMAIMARLVPSLRRSERRLREWMRDRPWIDGVDEWHRTLRPAAVARLRALAAVDVGGLDEAGLADHLLAVRAEWATDARLHISLGRHDMLPTCVFVAGLLEDGVDVSTAMSLLAGSSPVSGGGSPELDRLRGVLGGDLLERVDAAGLAPELDEALQEYLTMHAWRLVDGYDVDGPCLIENEDLILRRINAAPLPARTASSSLESEVRAALPRDRAATFDTDLAEARACYGLRDDNGHILISWSTGLLRRAMLQAGATLASAGSLEDPTLAIEATPEELADALRSVAPIDEAGLRGRRQRRSNLRAADAPKHLGGAPSPAPAGIPGALGKVMRAFGIAELGTDPPEEPLTGFGIGSGHYEGTARLVLGAGEGLDRFEPGDVLVTPMTSPSYNGLLAIAGALVCDTGGVLSHAAVMARELALPAVIGTGDATCRIDDGAGVAVDPEPGTVTVLAPAEREQAPS